MNSNPRSVRPGQSGADPLASFDSESNATLPVSLHPAASRTRVESLSSPVPRRAKSQWPLVISAVVVGAIVGIVYGTYGTPPPPPESLKDAMVPPPLPPPPAYTLGQSRATDVRDDGRIRAVLAAYLAHEFQAHKQQSVAVDPCTIQIIGTLATAKCEGVIEDIRKDGGAMVQSRKTSWSFVLERVSRNWQITDASVK